MPTNTNAMQYNSTHHVYTITNEYMRTTWMIDFVETEGSLTKANNRILLSAIRVYNFIYNHKERSKSFWEWFLAFDETVRPVIQRALEMQLIFEYETNANALHNNLGVNLLNGVVIPLEVLRGERGISLETINILRNYEDGVLLFTGKEMFLPSNITYDYTELGY